MKTVEVNLSDIRENPNNPRLIKDDKFKKLVQSIKDFPQMLAIRPIVVNADMTVLGGNMRLRACKEAGLKVVPIIKADTLTPEQQNEFIVKDNVGFGEWDWNILANEWDAELLSDWGLDVPNWGVGHNVNDEMNEDNLDSNEDFDPIGESSGQKKIVFTFDDEYSANSFLDKFSEYKSLIDKRGQAWQINLCTQFT